MLSPSSRRAWIEIKDQTTVDSDCPVALLAEGVDRNHHIKIRHPFFKGSPSSRRAWIEIVIKPTMIQDDFVALLAEGVDRNFI